MFDPCILVRDFGFVQIWHKDPCSDGSDDSCGWSYPKLSEDQRKAMRNLGFWEGQERHFLIHAAKENPGDRLLNESMYRSQILMVARVLGIKMSFDAAAKMAAEKNAMGRCDGMKRMFCFLPGWHTNYTEDRVQDRVDQWAQSCMSVARQLLLARRPWYRHPRWHVYHWRITSRTLARIFRRKPS